MAFDNHAGANKLARTLSNRMKNESKSSLVLVLAQSILITALQQTLSP